MKTDGLKPNKAGAQNLKTPNPKPFKIRIFQSLGTEWFGFQLPFKNWTEKSGYQTGIKNWSKGVVLGHFLILV